MKRLKLLFGALMINAVAFLGTALGQAPADGTFLINEIEVDPPGVDLSCQYFEIKGPANAPLTNIYALSVESQPGAQVGVIRAISNLSTQTVGSNGLLVISGTQSGTCSRTFPAETRVVSAAQFLLGSITSESYLLVFSTSTLAIGQDLDTNDDGTIDVAGVTVLDGYTFLVNTDSGEVSVGNVPILQFIDADGFPDVDLPDALTRFPGNNTPRSAAAVYYGNLSGSANSTTYTTDPAKRSTNFPAGGALTPGAPNVPAAPLAPTPRFDFNGDGRSDQTVFRAGTWLVNFSPNNGFQGVQLGVATDIIAPDDYDGDNKTDFAVWRPGTFSIFYILQSTTNTIRIEEFGAPGDRPIGGDWDGDNKDDLAVYRNGATAGAPSAFYYRPSGTPGTGFVTIPWGVGGDVQVAADYDGDNRFDAAVYRGGTWLARLSSNGQLFSLPFGVASDIPVPADYNGDGRDDQAVYRNGTWFANLSPSNTFVAIPFGAASDIPVPADYNGDGTDDQAVYRNGTWFANLSPSNTFIAIQFGAAGDRPIPAAYLQLP